jgi:Ca2+-binding RTX toxin-like protein
MAIIKGTSAPDTLIGTMLQDEIMGVAGNDDLYGGEGNDIIDGGSGSDNLFGGLGADLLRGGDGNDDLDGNEGDDTLIGGSGDDRFNGGDGNDSIEGGSGNDFVKVSAGTDVNKGGSGFDTLDFTAMGIGYGGPEPYEIQGRGAVIDISKSTASFYDGTATFTGFESYVGTAGADRIKGSNRSEVIDGGTGGDHIWSRGGADTVVGSANDIDTFEIRLGDLVDASGNLLGVDTVVNWDTFDDLLLVGFVPQEVLDSETPFSIHDYLAFRNTEAGSVLTAQVGGTSYDVALFQGQQFDAATLDTWMQVEGQLLLL